MDFQSQFQGGIKDLIDSILQEEIEKSGYKQKLQDTFDQLHVSIEKGVTSQVPDVQSVFDQTMQDVLKLENDSYEMRQSHRDLMNDIGSNQKHSPQTKEHVTLQPSSSFHHGLRTRSRVQSFETGNQKDTNLQPFVKYENKQGDMNAAPQSLAKPKLKIMLSDIVIEAGLQVLALHRDEWKEAVVVDQQRHRDKVKYKVRFALTNGKSLVQLNHLASAEAVSKFDLSQVKIGARIAANYKNDGIFSGVIAEVSRKKNRPRFLIFFDDGYATYCDPRHIYLVLGQRIDVWNDIANKPTADYIKGFLSNPVRPMLSMKEGQTLKVEFEGEWHLARCLRVDQSLVEVLYYSDNSREWIYRGSMRLERLYRQHQLAEKTRKEQLATPNRIARAHTGMRKAHIEYTIDLTRESTSPQPLAKANQKKTKSVSSDQSAEEASESSASKLLKEQKKATTRWKAPWEKSLSLQRGPWDGHNPNQITQLPRSYSEMQGGVDIASYLINRLEQKKTPHGGSEEGKSRSRSIDGRGATAASRFSGSGRSNSDPHNMEMYAHMVSRNSAVFSPHKCSPQCVAPFRQRKSLKGVNPLLKPLLMGWTREITRLKPFNQRPGFHCYYRAPCGRVCRCMDDIVRYVLECGIQNLDLTCFTLDSSVRVQNNTEVRPRDAKFFITDYSYGKEDIPVSCVNEINMDAPPKMPYTKERVNGRGVKINTSPDYMVCCDCIDNCRDKSKCPCQQLTVQATSCCRGGKMKPDAGYEHKRLYSFLPTGIYECSSRCKCNSQCMNRVVQLGLSCRLQMFKTQKKGWGIRCLDDIAQGTFVCIYTGKIQTEANANDEGLMNGDEYLAELDHIEVAENQKQDYNEDDSSGIDSQSDNDSNEDAGTGQKKSNMLYEDSTDTEDENADAERVKMILKRDSDSTWAVACNQRPTKLDEHKSDVKVFGTGGRKLGYSSDPELSPGAIPDAARRRRGKMVPRSNLPSNDSSIDSDSFSPQCELPKVNFLDDDFTTDTDSDTNDNNVRAPSVLTKSTSKGKGERMVVKDGDSSSDDEEINKTRRYFGTEGTFIIDAKQTGNLGRYLNHCCTPNLMVQNVFIDTHDLRFPWVAFFANSTIRAGTELTWDYNYEIGSVPDRVIHCYCGSTKCRKRML